MSNRTNHPTNITFKLDDHTHLSHVDRGGESDHRVVAQDREREKVCFVHCREDSERPGKQSEQHGGDAQIRETEQRPQRRCDLR